MEDAEAVLAGHHVDGEQELAEVAADARMRAGREKRGGMCADMREHGEHPSAIVVKDLGTREEHVVVVEIRPREDLAGFVSLAGMDGSEGRVHGGDSLNR